MEQGKINNVLALKLRVEREFEFELNGRYVVFRIKASFQNYKQKSIQIIKSYHLKDERQESGRREGWTC